MPSKVIITGPESTGKSLLCEALTTTLNVLPVWEYARQYLANLGRPYNESDMEIMAQRQYRDELKAMQQDEKTVLCDTDLLTYKIWWEVRYGYCPEWIDEHLRTRPGDFWLLCDIDLPWENDVLREHPDRREELMDRYTNALRQLQFPCAVVSGAGNERAENAINILRQYGFLDQA